MLEKKDQIALPRYELKVVNGELSLAGLKDRMGKFGGAAGVTANLGIIVDIVRDLHTNADIVMLPGLAKIKIDDLRMRSTDEPDDAQVPRVLQALSVASGNRFVWRKEPSGIDPATGLPLHPGAAALYILDSPADPFKPIRSVEVFNMTGYIRHLGKQDEREVDNNLLHIGEMINETLRSVKREDFAAEDAIKFQFHPGASLFVAIGPPESLEVARKVVSALPGQAGFPGPGFGGSNMSGFGGGGGGGGFQPMSPGAQQGQSQGQSPKPKQ